MTCSCSGDIVHNSCISMCRHSGVPQLGLESCMLYPIHVIVSGLEKFRQKSVLCDCMPRKERITSFESAESVLRIRGTFNLFFLTICVSESQNLRIIHVQFSDHIVKFFFIQEWIIPFWSSLNLAPHYDLYTMLFLARLHRKWPEANLTLFVIFDITHERFL